MKPINQTLASAVLAIPILLGLGNVQAAPGDLHRGTVISVIDDQTVRLARYGGGELRVHFAEPIPVDRLRNALKGGQIVVEERGWAKGQMLGEWETASNGI